MGELLKNLFLVGVELLAKPGCILKEEVNPFNSDHLGDRSTYYGASEAAAECQRKEVSNRLFSKKSPELNQIMVMAMGHLVEVMIYLIFAAQGKKPKREVAVYHPTLPWLRATIDMLWVAVSGAKIMEIKCRKNTDLMQSDIWQNTLQQGIWRLNNPGKTSTGVVLVFDRVCGYMQEHPVVYDHDLFLALVARAEASWAAINGQGPLPDPIPNLLCGFCNHREQCPMGKPAEGDALPKDIAAAAELLLSAKKIIKAAEADEKKAKEIIKTFSNGVVVKGRSEHAALTVYYKKGRASIDNPKIKEAMAERFSAEEIEAIYAAATSYGKPSATIEIEELS